MQPHWIGPSSHLRYANVFGEVFATVNEAGIETHWRIWPLGSTDPNDLPANEGKSRTWHEGVDAAHAALDAAHEAAVKAAQ